MTTAVETTGAYLDYGAASPVDPRVLAAMQPYWSERFGNPSSLYQTGQEAQSALEEARADVARLIGAESPQTLVFTSGATEANNLALIGYALRQQRKGRRILLSAIEHMSVINPAKYLEKQGFEVLKLPVDGDGLLAPATLEEALTEQTILVSVQWANPEIGVIQAIPKLGAICRQRGVALHVDATAAAGKIPIDDASANVDLLTLSSNDLYGPKGAGALYLRKGIRVDPQLLGGGQESGLRSGSENMAALVGFGMACELAESERGAEAERLQVLRDQLIEGVLNAIPRSYLTGHRTRRLPHHASFRFDFVEGESIVISLALSGIAASSGSACTSKTLEPSHVLLALGLKHEQAHGSLVCSLGRWSTEAHVGSLLAALPPIIARLRAMSPLYEQGQASSGSDS